MHNFLSDGVDVRFTLFELDKRQHSMGSAMRYYGHKKLDVLLVEQKNSSNN